MKAGAYLAAAICLMALYGCMSATPVPKDAAPGAPTVVTTDDQDKPSDHARNGRSPCDPTTTHQLAGPSPDPKLTHEDMIVRDLEEAARRFTCEQAHLLSWSVDKVVLTELNRSLSDARAEVLFQVDVTHRMNLPAPEYSPRLRGMLAWYEENRMRLSPREREQAARQINEVRRDIERHMTTATHMSQAIKVTATLDGTRKVLQHSVKVFLDQGVRGRLFVPGEQVLQGTPTAIEVYQKAYEGMQRQFHP